MAISLGILTQYFQTKPVSKFSLPSRKISHMAGMEDPVAGSQSGAVTVASLKATKSMLGFEDGSSSGSSSEAQKIPGGNC